jgi:tetratricopeptide (TPR) repeat protein
LGLALAVLVIAVVWISWWWMGAAIARPSESTLKAWLREGIEAVKRGDAAGAAAYLDGVLEWRPDHGEALLYRGQIAHEQGQAKAAREFFERVPDMPARLGSAARYAGGIAAIDQGLAREGEQQLLRAVELNPALLAARDRLVELYSLQMRRDDVRRQLDTIRLQRPLRLEEVGLYAVAGQRITKPDEGIRRMEKFCSAAPDDVSSRLLMARYLIDAEQLPKAEQTLQRVLTDDPRSSQAAGLLAEVKIQQEDLPGALRALARVNPQAQPDMWYYRSAGRLWLKWDQWQLAADCLTEAVRLDPEDLTATHQLGIALGRLRSDAATACLRRAELMDRVIRESGRIPGRDHRQIASLVEIVLEVADTLSELARYREAADWYQQALILDPRLISAQSGLAAVESQQRSKTVSVSQAADPTATDRSIAWATLLDRVRDEAARLPAERAAEAVVSAAIRLTDVHHEAGINFQYFNGQTGLKYLVESMGGGVAVIDYDVDGWPDLYLVQGSVLPYDPQNTAHQDRLFRNRGDGRFEDVTAAAGLGDNQYGQGCAVGDFDNDGYPDLFVANFGRSVLYHNNGDGTFRDVTVQSSLAEERWSSSAGFADLDKDGFLELYVSNYVTSLRVCRGTNGHVATCDPGNFDAEQDRLYRNLGDGRFEDVTQSSGIVAPGGKGLGLILADFDNDDWTDIYVANDGTPNHLFKNTSRSGQLAFQEIALLAGVAVSGDGKAQGSMGIACVDFEHDGLLDLYVTNFIDETYTLYRNLGDMLFEDATRRSGTAPATKPYVGFGVQPIDFDLDGLFDMVIANGHIDDFRFRQEQWKMPSQVFRNIGDGRFTDVSREAGPYFGGEYLGRGVARVDFDRDGDDDAVVVHQDAPLALLRNDTTGQGNWLGFLLHGVASSRDAIGARIEVHTSAGIRILENSAGDGFFSSNERCCRLGLGAIDHVDKAVVKWPSGLVQTLAQPPINQVHVLIEGMPPALP